MGFHLLALDLDGTLLNSRKEISPRTFAAVVRARREAGVHVVLASARPPRTVLPFHTALDLDTPMVNYNGALVYDPLSKRVLMHRPVQTKVARRIAAIARRICPESVLSAEVLDQWYTDRFDPRYLTETAMLCRPDEIAPVEQWLVRPITKLLVLGPADALGEIAAAIRRQCRHDVTIVRTENDLLQIMHATASKGAGLRAVAAELAVPRERVVAVGDQTNDTDMLAWAGLGVAMGSAPAEVRAVADVVVADHDSDGVAEAVERVVLPGRGGRRR